MTRYCMHCMQPIGEQDATCPFCGQSPTCDVPEHYILPGSVLNHRYYVGAALGQGGFGITYIGRDINLDMRVAIKEFYPTGYVNRNNANTMTVRENTDGNGNNFFEKGRERFLREARALAKFAGEVGIVNVRDFFEENNTAYIVMEYLDGQTLKSYLAETGKLEPDKALTLLMPVLQSLAKVHKSGIIHRDISPDNIMIVGDHVKLLDFGAAREVGGDKSLSIMLKHGYAPEEQYRSRGKQGPWTDIYAICAVLYKCITGITPDDALDRMAEDEIQTPSKLGIFISADYEKALMKGLAVFQKDRYQSIDELLLGFKGITTAVVEEGSTVYMASDNTEGTAEEPVNDKGAQAEAEDDKETVYVEQENTETQDTEEEKATVYVNPEKTEEEKATVYMEPEKVEAKQMVQPLPEKPEVKEPVKIEIKKPEAKEPVQAEVKKTENKEFANAATENKNETKKTKTRKKTPIYAIFGFVAVILVIGVILFAMSGGSGSADYIEENEETKTQLASNTSISTNSESVEDEDTTKDNDVEYTSSEDSSSDGNTEETSGSTSSNPLFDYTVEIDEVEYQFPCETSDFLDNGWAVYYSYDEDTLIAGRSYYNFTLENESTGHKLYIVLYNCSGNATSWQDCEVSGFSTLSYYSSVAFVPQITLPGGLDLASITKEDLQATYGDVSGSYEETDYTQYYYLEDTWNIDSSNGVSIDIANDGSDYFNGIYLLNWSGNVEDTETNTEVPDYISDYVAPTELGDDDASGNVEIDGELYRIMCPVSEFINNGWELVLDDGEEDVLASNWDTSATLVRGDEEISIEVQNLSSYQTTVENCAVYRITLEVGDVESITLAGGVAMGMSDDDVVEILTASSYDYTQYESDYGNSYSLYEYDYKISIDIYMDAEQNVDEISVYRFEWDY